MSPTYPKIVTYTPEQQRALLEKHALFGLYRAHSLIHRKQNTIMALMLDRCASDWALKQYGDEMFRQSYDELDRNSMEEAADLVAREAVWDMKEKGVIP